MNSFALTAPRGRYCWKSPTRRSGPRLRMSQDRLHHTLSKGTSHCHSSGHLDLNPVFFSQINRKNESVTTALLFLYLFYHPSLLSPFASFLSSSIPSCEFYGNNCYSGHFLRVGSALGLGVSAALPRDFFCPVTSSSM